MGRKNHRSYKFQGMPHSIDGIISSSLGGISIVLVIVEMVMTIYTHGQASGIVGILGIAALLMSIMGLVFAIVSWKDEDSVDMSKRIGTGMNSLMLLVNVVLAIFGIFAR